MKKYQVIFQPSGKRGKILKGQTILEASRELGVGIESLCDGKRVCGKCKVKVEEKFSDRYGIVYHPNHLFPFTKEEEKFIDEVGRAEGFRLSCAAQVRGDVLIFVPKESRIGKQVIRKAVTDRLVKLKPAISVYYLELPPPSLSDTLGDFDRLSKGLSERYNLPPLKIDHQALMKLSSILRQGNWKVTVSIWMEEEIIDIRLGKAEDIYGLAIDIGTTTVAGYLCNLRNGEVVAMESIMNPQVAYGEDVMSRISYVITHRSDGLQKLNQSIIDGLNLLIQTMTKRNGLYPNDILELTVVGNTAMHHLFLKISPEYLGVVPFPPVIQRSINVKARELGLKAHPAANVHILPIEAGFVGADNVGVLLAEEPHHQEKMILLIDVGTNGELVMGNNKKLLSSSCATGPAFEGAHIKFGMRATSGAIERVRINPETLEVDFKVVGKEFWKSESKSVKAKGICGSGVIDTIAELYRNGIIDKSGRFSSSIKSSRMRIFEGKPEFIIARQKETSIGKEISITQADLRNVQLAKGAIYTGAKLMMKRLGIERLDKVIIAGAFGSYIDKEKAMILGMFPDCDLANVSAVGNAAGEGARIALLNKYKREEAESLARKVEYIELTIETDFQKEFIYAMQIPHTRDLFPHLKNIVREEILIQ